MEYMEHLEYLKCLKYLKPMYGYGEACLSHFIFALIKLPRIWNIAIYRYRWVHIDRYRYTHILWGDNLRERNNQWIKVHWLFPSLGGCQGGRDSWWWILGAPETHVPVLAFCHVGTLWIRCWVGGRYLENIVVRCRRWDWSRIPCCAILLGFHFIGRNINPIIMFHLLWNIELSKVCRILLHLKNMACVNGKTT